MQIEFRYDGKSRTKSLLKECTMDDVVLAIKTLFDINKVVDGEQDFDLKLVNNAGGLIGLENPPKQLYNGAVVDVKCLNNGGQTNNNNNNNNIIKDIKKLNISEITDESDSKNENENQNQNENKAKTKLKEENIVNHDDDIKNKDIVNNISNDEIKKTESSIKTKIETLNGDNVSIAINNIKNTMDKTTNNANDTINNQNNNNNNQNNNNNHNIIKAQRYVVRLRGLPWSARETEITEFFSEENIIEIQIVFLTDGRASGEALVEFSDVNSFQTAFLKNRHHIGHRYIEIFKSTGMEIDTAAGRAVRPPAKPPKSQYVIRMRGLPYSATDQDVNDFFSNTIPTGIHLIKDDLGRPSGEGFVEFKTEVDAIAAMAKHRHHMGHRYIELFRSSPEELMRALGLTTGWYNSRNGPQPKSTCILMRGLPYSCTESDITKFFQEIDVTPIRIHRKADGAEAYVEFYSISDTDKAMTRHRNYIGRRYIELFRVTYEDMARTVGLPVANTNIPASALSINAAINPNQQLISSSIIMSNTKQQQQQQHAYQQHQQHSYHQYQQQQQQQQQQQHHYYQNNNQNNNTHLLLSAANINALMTNPLVVNSNPHHQPQQQQQQQHYHQSINNSQPNSSTNNINQHHYQQRQPQQQYYQPQYYH